MSPFQKAERKKAKLRLALIGPSGSGKSYSALLIAQGLGGKVAMIDTERGSGELYCDLTEYDVAQLNEPFTPSKYIELIKTAEKGGYGIIIIDSLTHAWAGEGGLLDMHDKAAKSVKNSFTAWKEVTPEHNRLVNTILNSPSHIIVTVRTKTAYEIVDNEKGKKQPVKIGLAPVFRDGIEYEFTTVFDMTIEGHVACASKDRTSLFDGQYFTPSRETGERLIKWLETGVVSTPAEPTKPTDTNYKFRQIMGKFKKDLGEEYYYAILGAEGFAKSTDIEDREAQKRVYNLMAKALEEKQPKAA